MVAIKVPRSRRRGVRGDAVPPCPWSDLTSQRAEKPASVGAISLTVAKVMSENIITIATV